MTPKEQDVTELYRDPGAIGRTRSCARGGG